MAAPLGKLFSLLTHCLPCGVRLLQYQGCDSPDGAVLVHKRWIALFGNSWLKPLSDTLRATVVCGERVSERLTFEAVCFPSQICCCLLLVLTEHDHRNFSPDFLNSVQGYLSSSPLQLFRLRILVVFSLIFPSPQTSNSQPLSFLPAQHHFLDNIRLLNQNLPLSTLQYVRNNTSKSVRGNFYVNKKILALKSVWL